MKDAVTVGRVALLHPAIRQEVSNAITAIECNSLPKNAQVRIVQGYRSFAEQQAIYNQGRTTAGKIVSNAKPGSSFHNYGLAIDFVIMYDKNNDGNYETVSWDINMDFDKDGTNDWKEVYLNFTSLGWTWGGTFRTFKDYPHLEKSFGYGWRDLLAMHTKKQFIPGTQYVKI